MRRGFTLIELLVVVSIISLLSSIVFAAVGSGRARAQDVAQKETVRRVGLAIAQHILDRGVPPPHYGTVGQAALSTDSGSPNAFTRTMQDLVDRGYLGEVPPTTINGQAFGFIDYGAGNSNGAVIYTVSLPSGTAGMGGVAGSCNISSGSSQSLPSQVAADLCPSGYTTATLLPNSRVQCTGGGPAVIAKHPIMPNNDWVCGVSSGGSTGLQLSCQTSYYDPECGTLPEGTNRSQIKIGNSLVQIAEAAECSTQATAGPYALPNTGPQPCTNTPNQGYCVCSPY
jgi:prepilin-type N-terminal cleavage/methylation domain-containing protein